jgi:hypothetical protein
MSVHQETHETILKEDFKRIDFLFNCVDIIWKNKNIPFSHVMIEKKMMIWKEKYERVPSWNCQVGDHLKDCAKTFLY